MTPTVLVGIVTRNRATILPKVISSALSQKGVNVRVSVIDDASNDTTAEIAQTFPMVEWIHWPTNRGYMAARNYWMTSACEDYFVSLDDDAWFLDGDEIALAIETMARDARIAAVAFDILSSDRPHRVERSPARPTATFIGCGHVLRLATIRSVGVYERTPGSYGGEEKDLCLRLMDVGYRTVLLPGVHVWHDKTPVARELRTQYRSGVCNDLVMTFRRTPTLVVPLALVAKFAQHLVFAVKHGSSRDCLKAFALFFRSIPALWRSRRPVRASTLRAFMRLVRS